MNNGGMRKWCARVAVLLGLGTAAFGQSAPWWGNVPAANLWDTPTAQMTEAARREGPCTDPWVSIALWRRNKQPVGFRNEGDCNAANFNGGSWANFRVLVDAVVDYNRMMQSAGAAFKFVKAGNEAYVALTGPASLGLDGKIIAVGGNNIVAVGGANIIANGGGNIIANGGMNLLAPGGGNLASLPLVTTTSGFVAQSTGTKVVAGLGKSSLVLRRR